MRTWVPKSILFDMIQLMDRDNFEAEASKETLPMPLPFAGVAQSWSPLASLTTFLFAWEARVFHEAEARFVSSSKCQVYLDMGRVFQGMFPIVGIGILLGFVMGVYCVLAGKKDPRVTWPSWLWEGCWWSDSGDLGRSLSMRREDETSISW